MNFRGTGSNGLYSLVFSAAFKADPSTVKATPGAGMTFFVRDDIRLFRFWKFEAQAHPREDGRAERL